MRKIKRITSIFLSAVLVLGLIGVPAFAEEESWDFEFTLEYDLTMDWPIFEGERVYLNLNGHVMTGYVDNMQGGTAVIEDTTGGGAITGTVESNGELIITGGGTFTTVNNYGGTATISGGTFTTLNNYGGAVTISGGTFTTVNNYDDGTVTNSGGTFDYEEGTITISGGTFGSDVSEFLDVGCVVTYDEETKTYTVTKANYVAFVTDGDGNVTGQYETIADAIANAGAGDTVTLLNDVIEDVNVSGGTDIILDLNGYTLKYEDPSAKYTITNYGVLTIRDSVGTGTVEKYTGSVINYSPGELTIESGNFTVLVNRGGTATINGGSFADKNGCVTNDRNGVLIINGGTFDTRDHPLTSTCVQNGAANSTSSPGTATINGGIFYWNGETIGASGYGPAISNNTGSTLEINGGTYYCTNTAFAPMTPATMICPDTTVISDKCGLDTNEDGSWTVGEASISVTIDDSTAKYVYLANAIRAAGADEATVTLLKDIEVSGATTSIPEDANITLELNGYTLTITEVSLTNEGNLTIQDSSEAGTGAIVNTDAKYVVESSSSSDNRFLIGIWNTGTLTIESGDFIFNGSILWSRAGGQVTINGGTFEPENPYVLTFDMRIWSSEVTINGGTLYCAVQFDDGAEGTINDGTFYGRVSTDGDATLTINGGSFTVSKGATVIVDGTTTFTITDGVFTAGPDVPGAIDMSVGWTTAKVTGGTFNKGTLFYNYFDSDKAGVADALSVPDGYVVWDNGDGTWTVRQKPEYELYFDVQTYWGTDGNGNVALDVAPGETFTATLYLQNDMEDKELTVQAFDIYAVHDANLICDDIRIGDGVYANTEGSTDTDTHIQSVATDRDITLAAGTKVALATFTFTVSDSAGEEAPMLIGFAEDKDSNTTHLSLEGNYLPAYPAKRAMSVDVYQPYEVVFQNYTYAKPGDVLMIVAPGSSNVLKGGQGYTYNGEAMFYTKDASYTGAIPGADSVYVYLIPANEMETAAFNIGVGNVKNEEITRDGDVNGDTSPMIADANAVYQLLLNQGDYYLNPDIGILARLKADVYTQWDGVPAPRGTIDDVFAIVDIVNGADSENG